MGIKWVNGSPQQLTAQLSHKKKVFYDEAEEIVTQTADEAAELQRMFLDRATTPWGETRFASGRGRSAGRNDTGEMIDSIEVEISRTKTSLTGAWGWPKGYEKYFQIQEWGLGVPEAHSLLDSMMAVRATFIRRVRKLAGK